MNLDIASVPFSRYGSYMAISRRPQTADHASGVVVRTLHGDAESGDVFLIELILDGKVLGAQETTKPGVLKLDARQGFARFCFDTPDCIRFQARNVGVRLTLYGAGALGFAVPLGDGRWQVNGFAQRASYGLTVIRGQMRMDAPWQSTGAKHVIAEFLPNARGGATIEGAIEEFVSVLPPRKFARSFDECVRDVDREFERWQKLSPAVPEAMEDAGRLAAYVNWSAVVAARGHFRRSAMLMSKNGLSGLSSWGHAFNAMALSHHHPDVAWDQLLLPFDQQDAGGAVPDYHNDGTLVRNFVKPPIQGWALRYMMKAGSTVTARRLKEFYTPLAAWTDWWMEHRDFDHDGIPQYLHGRDSGWDNCTVFDIGVPLESPDLSSLLIVQMDVLAEIAGRIGKKREAHRWVKRADQLLEKLLPHSWRGDRFVAPRSGDHKTADGDDSLVLFAPIILGKRLPHDVREKLVAGLAKEGRFLAAHGLATQSAQSPKYASDAYCRGPVWAPSTMLIVDGLISCGRQDLAAEIAMRFCRTVADSGMAESFDALTGTPLGDPACTCTSSVFQMLAHDVVRPSKKL